MHCTRLGSPCQAPLLCLPCVFIWMWGLNPFAAQGVVLTEFSGVSLVLVLEETGKFTSVPGNSLSS